MRAVAIQQHGGPEVLQVVELPEPTLQAQDVLVRVKAVALNHLDVWLRRGGTGLKPSLPHVPGSNVAGVVERVGAEVKDLALGTEVIVNPGLSCGHCEACLMGEDPACRGFRLVGEHVPGGYAEYVAVPRRNVVPKPAQLSFAQAACLPLSFLTAWTMLARRAQVKPGEWVLVQAAGSGVGSAAVQICKLLGATVIATASSAAKLDRIQQLGADHLINYSEQDFPTEVRRLTRRRMVDVVVEHTGAATFEKSVACLAGGGRLVLCGATTGAEVNLDLRVFFARRLSLLGSTLGSKGDLLHVLRLVEQGKLKPVLDRTLPLEEAAQAHHLLEQRAQFGHIVLTP
ncbi:zinc-binding dehydrogenase [Vitiosangium sp. GDMCC 1.1324]|uniref:zinc-binding dehydrogenase n=1 Tax=Vitiosangium sp. (strain GDMCC 1.1324) TaxID=2138576 RepID=UPI000D3A9B94|nr:zinc-binding dehydrogenase [Vitiosangium sp. GDMCC 1.1324]PTL80867.1 alcohol dehydrogenase [Vitiosangium sp. GDMCC 1.1324]